MRVRIFFDTPLDADARVRMQLAIAGLAKSSRMRWIEGGRGVLVIGEAMSRERVGEALQEQDLQPTHIESSLDEDENAEADDVEVTSTKERLRAIGR
ncbi:MAG: hypothetical protein ACOCXJ_02055 [Planctomycetota bacterium]